MQKIINIRKDGHFELFDPSRPETDIGKLNRYVKVVTDDYQNLKYMIDYINEQVKIVDYYKDEIEKLKEVIKSQAILLKNAGVEL